MGAQIGLPRHGRSREELLQEMRALRSSDVNWQDGRVFSLVFPAGGEALQLLKDAYTLYFSENALNPTAFPSLRRMETEVIAMSATLLGSQGQVVGNMTSGGTESILMAVKTARDWARAERPDITAPEMVLPRSAHPAFDKAGHYFGVRAVHTPLTPDFQADVAAIRQAITPNTILLIGSAPSYPQGVVDPIPELAALAQEHGLLCHVDACVGGFMLPFVRRLGYPVPEFDFAVPGVTSLSADLHKYGYAAKGASLILYRDAALRRHQLFAYTDWPGGIYASPTMGGTRPGGAIAAAWAIMNYLGEEGYLKLAGEVMAVTRQIQDGVAAIAGIEVLGRPVMSVMALGSSKVNVYEVGDEMGLRGWHLDRQQFPPSLHLTINPAHVRQTDAFLHDLQAAVRAARRLSPQRLVGSAAVRAANLASRALPAPLVSRLMAGASTRLGGDGLPGRSAPMYGMMGTLPNRGDLRELVLDLVEQFTRPQEEG
ncbi:MAG: aspartate aminotransferase family protein [Chloroflexi bacterium]|nr:aspartate aminotransferase family protein [Chloroflexota bacterium]